MVFILSFGKDKQPSGNTNCSFDFSTILGLIKSSEKIYLGEKLITNIDDIDIHSLHRKLKDSPQDIMKENLDLLKELIKK